MSKTETTTWTVTPASTSDNIRFSVSSDSVVLGGKPNPVTIRQVKVVDDSFDFWEESFRFLTQPSWQIIALLFFVLFRGQLGGLLSAIDAFIRKLRAVETNGMKLDASGEVSGVPVEERARDLPISDSGQLPQ